MPTRKILRRVENHSDGAHHGQVLWTVCVALAVAFFALQHALGSRSEQHTVLMSSPEPTPSIPSMMRSIGAESSLASNR